MTELYPHSRQYSFRKTLENFGIDIPRLARHLGTITQENPRIGDLGCGEGITAQHLLDIRFHTIGIDPRTANQLPKSAFIRGYYPEEVQLPHRPHLIYAHKAVAMLDFGHPFYHNYADFNIATPQILQDLHPQAGVAILFGPWNSSRNPRPVLDHARNIGFNIFDISTGKPGMFNLVFARPTLDITNFQFPSSTDSSNFPHQLHPRL